MAPTVCSWIEPEHIRRIKKISKEVQNISDYIAKVSERVEANFFTVLSLQQS